MRRSIPLYFCLIIIKLQPGERLLGTKSWNRRKQLAWLCSKLSISKLIFYIMFFYPLKTTNLSIKMTGCGFEGLCAGILCYATLCYAKLTVSWLQLHICQTDMGVVLIFPSNSAGKWIRAFFKKSNILLIKSKRLCAGFLLFFFSPFLCSKTVQVKEFSISALPISFLLTREGGTSTSDAENIPALGSISPMSPKDESWFFFLTPSMICFSILIIFSNSSVFEIYSQVLPFDPLMLPTGKPRPHPTVALFFALLVDQ